MSRHAQTRSKPNPGSAARTALRVAAACLCALIGLCALGSTTALAAVTHEFLPNPTAKVNEGAPAGSPVGLTGPVGRVRGMAAEAGHMWLAEEIELENSTRTRVDEVDAGTGLFVSPHQLDEEGGVFELGFAGVAVGDVLGEEEKYVTANLGGKLVVAAYGSSDELQATWEGASTANGTFGDLSPGPKIALSSIAVDGSVSLETSGDVYVATYGPVPADKAVNVFKPEAGGKEPAKTVGEILGTCKVPGVCSGNEVVPFVQPVGVSVSGFNGDVLVADGPGEECRHGTGVCVVDVFEPVVGMPGVYSYLFQIKGTPNDVFTSIAPMAVNAKNGNIYILEEEANVVDEFSPTGQFIGQVTGTTGPQGEPRPFPSVESVGVDSSVSGNVFVATDDREKHVKSIDVFGPDVVIPDVVSEAPSEVGPSSAQLNGEVNPDKEGEASCRFVWGTTTGFGKVAACEPEKVAEGNVLVGVHAKLEGLAPDTEYCYRLEASNKNGTNAGEEWQDECFVTPGPGLHGESVSDVSSTAATLREGIDPNGSATSYYVQYGRTSAYEVTVPLAPGVGIGSAKGNVEVQRHLQGLASSTTYHYRIVVVSEVRPGEPETFPGPDQTFVTQSADSSVVLPDGRGWELVSPPEKYGASFLSIGESAVIQAAADGSGLAYLASSPTEPQVPGYIDGREQVLSTRGVNGWSSRDLSLPQGSATSAFAHEYRMFSADLSVAGVEPTAPFTSLAPEVFPPETEQTPYVRHDATCSSTPATCYEPLVTGAPGYADVPEGTVFGGSSLQLRGASSDLSHVVFSTDAALKSPPTGGTQLYEWSAGSAPEARLELVSSLENGHAAVAQLGYEDGQHARNAVSEDGTRIVWSEFSLVPHLYLRDMSRPFSLQLDVPQAECVADKQCGEGPVSPDFQLASRDGSRVFFTDRQRLTANASPELPGKADLYECRIVEEAGNLRCVLSDLTPAPGAGEAADVQGGVLGASEDGSWLYFVANSILGDGAEHGATTGNCRLEDGHGEGECNLYVWHNGSTKFIAVLPGEDESDWAGMLNDLTARVSPDGEWLAFMSKRSLTGYDNRDAASGLPDEEVFLYHAQSTGPASLVCASCNPTGARPQGVEYRKLNDKMVGGDRVWALTQWIAANVPGWTPYELNHAVYQSRYLSNQGRLFFNSSDPLVAGDINKNEDVYEYEPPGIGDCSTDTTTYSEGSAGCVNLISSGIAAGESAFLDASESGDDVFFLTGEKLVSADIDTAFDVYDARVCTAAAPCPNPLASSPPCDTADACRSAPEPQPAIFGAPSSATFTGQGNVTQPGPVPVVKPKSLTRAQKLARALSACHKKRAKGRRAVCERQARKQYGAKRSGKKATVRRGR